MTVPLEDQGMIVVRVTLLTHQTLKQTMTLEGGITLALLNENFMAQQAGMLKKHPTSLIQ